MPVAQIGLWCGCARTYVLVEYDAGGHGVGRGKARHRGREQARAEVGAAVSGGGAGRGQRRPVAMWC